MLLLSAVGGGFVVVVDDCVSDELRYKKTEDPINPSILYLSHNYNWSTRACLVDEKEDLKKGCKQTNKQYIFKRILIMVCILVCLHPFF